MKILPLLLTLLLTLCTLLGCGSNSTDSEPIAPGSLQELGRRIFFDTQLSTPPGQACSSCHGPKRAFSDPRTEQGPTSEGAVAGRFGFRNAPSIAYSAFAPVFHYDEGEEDFLGGQFWDGRATSLEEQAARPLLGASEMNNGSKAELVAKIQGAEYQPLMKAIFGANVFDDTDAAFRHVTEALAAFENSSELNSFRSRYDRYLQGHNELTAQELRGLALFTDPKKGNCSACHPSAATESGTPPLFTDFSYDNIGVPKNLLSPFLALPPDLNPDGARFLDRGLEKTTGRSADAGRFKVPTLRNVSRTAPYFHNGVFTTLEEVVHFYNRRDAEHVPAEIPSGVNTEELGDLKLTAEEEADIVAFLRTLDDQ